MMKKNFIFALTLTASLLLSVISVNAQPGGMGGGMPRGGMPGGPMGMMGGSVSGLPDFDKIGNDRSAALQEKLGLDDTQTKKLAKIIAGETEAKMNTLLSSASNMSMDNMMRQMMGEQIDQEVDYTVSDEIDKISAKFDKKYQKLLTPEQYNQYKSEAVDSEYINELMKNVKQDSNMPPFEGGMPGGGFGGGFGGMGGGPM